MTVYEKKTLIEIPSLNDVTNVFANNEKLNNIGDFSAGTSLLAETKWWNYIIF